MKLTDAGNIYFPTEDGHFISEKQRRIAEVLKDYDPNLQLQWIPTDQRGSEDKAFRVVDVTPGRAPYAVTFADECDERLLARVFQADGTKRNNLNYLDAHNAAIEALELKQRLESQEEMHRMSHAILRSQKINYRHKGINFGQDWRHR